MLERASQSKWGGGCHNKDRKQSKSNFSQLTWEQSWQVWRWAFSFLCSNVVIHPSLCKCDVTGDAVSTQPNLLHTTGAAVLQAESHIKWSECWWINDMNSGEELIKRFSKIQKEESNKQLTLPIPRIPLTSGKMTLSHWRNISRICY